MASWFNAYAQEYLKPVYNKHHKYLLKQSVIHANETTCEVLHEDDKTTESKSYIWLYNSGAFEKHRIVIYESQPSRGGYHAAKFLADFKASFIRMDSADTTD